MNRRHVEPMSIVHAFAPSEPLGGFAHWPRLVAGANARPWSVHAGAFVRPVAIWVPRRHHAPFDLMPSNPLRRLARIPTIGVLLLALALGGCPPDVCDPTVPAADCGWTVDGQWLDGCCVVPVGRVLW